MAKIKFLIRTAGNDATIYFRYKPNTNLDVTFKTPFTINSDYWDSKIGGLKSDAIKPKAKTTEQKVLNKLLETVDVSLKNFRADFSTYILNNPTPTKEEIKSYIDETYFAESKPQKNNSAQIPNRFSDFVDFYIKEKSKTIAGKQNAISDATRKKITTIKNIVDGYDAKLLIGQIDDDFRDNFADFLARKRYSQSTIIKALKYIKTICSFAHKKKVAVDSDVLHWEFIQAVSKFTPPILSLKEIEQIQQTILTKDHLENARDWLVIGCFTGARVSDLLNFNSANIIDGNLLKFTQKKTATATNGAEEIIYLFPEVIKILNKRDGEFPRKISDQKFNEYIKEVCKIAGIDKKMIGGVRDKEAGKHGKKIVKEFEKWELVTSHICRRSFVTNFIEVLGKDVKSQTGHRTDEIVKLYDKTEQIDKALRVKDKIERHLKIV